MQEDQNFCLYVDPTGTPYLSSGTYTSSAETACMKKDGNFVVEGYWKWATNTAGNPGAYAILRNDGYFVIMLGNRELWKSPTATCPLLLPTTTTQSTSRRPTTTKLCDPGLSMIRSGSCLNLDQSIYTCNGCYFAIMQGDGNFVIYTSKNFPFFASNTQGLPSLMACMQLNGNFAVLGKRGRIIYQTKTFVPGSDAILGEDGYFRILNGGQEIWNSNRTADCPY